MRHRLIALTCGLAEVRVNSSAQRVETNEGEQHRPWSADENQSDAKHSNLGQHSNREDSNADDYVQFIHQSVYDFLVTKRGLNLIAPDKYVIRGGAAHSLLLLSLRCITFVQLCVHDVYEDFLIPSADYSHDFESNLPFMKHAVVNWVWYVVELELMNNLNEERIIELLDHLGWPECGLLIG